MTEPLAWAVKAVAPENPHYQVFQTEERAEEYLASSLNAGYPSVIIPLYPRETAREESLKKLRSALYSGKNAIIEAAYRDRDWVAIEAACYELGWFQEEPPACRACGTSQCRYGDVAFHNKILTQWKRVL